MKDKLLIIGGTGDIAQGIIPKLSNQYDIVVTYRSKDKLEKIKDNVVDSFNMDLSENQYLEQIDYVISSVFAKHDIKKVLFANGNMINNLLITTSEKEIESLIFNNVKVNIILVKEVIKKFVKKRKDIKNIVILTSLAGDVGNSGQSVYSLTKGSMVSFMKSIAREYASKKIICNTLSLGLVDETKMKETISIKVEKTMQENIPLKRFCNYNDIALALEFLLKTEYLTGQNIKLNGGLL